MITEKKFENHEEWLELRRHSIGGSDASAVIGMNPYKSAYTLWAEKTGKIAEFEGNITTAVGSYLEEFVAKLFEEQTGKKVRRKNATMFTDIYPWAHANVDRLIVGEKALLEIKTTTSIPTIKKLRNSAEFPEIYYAQVVHYLAVTGLEKAYLAVLIECRELKIYELERDQAEIDALMQAESEFWSHVQDNTPPAVDGSRSCSETIDELYPNSNDDSVDLSMYAQELRQYIELTESIEKLETAKKECANKIKAFMGESGSGACEGFKVSYKASMRNTFDTKAYASANPGIDLSPYYKGSLVRQFRVTEK